MLVTVSTFQDCLDIKIMNAVSRRLSYLGYKTKTLDINNDDKTGIAIDGGYPTLSKKFYDMLGRVDFKYKDVLKNKLGIDMFLMEVIWLDHVIKSYVSELRTDTVFLTNYDVFKIYKILMQYRTFDEISEMMKSKKNVFSNITYDTVTRLLDTSDENVLSGIKTLYKKKNIKGMSRFYVNFPITLNVKNDKPELRNYYSRREELCPRELKSLLSISLNEVKSSGKPLADIWKWIKERYYFGKSTSIGSGIFDKVNIVNQDSELNRDMSYEEHIEDSAEKIVYKILGIANAFGVEKSKVSVSIM